MYRDFDDPWRCNEATNDIRRDICLFYLFRDRRYQNILDIGCGLGAFTEKIRKTNGAGSITGIDISQTAISKAIQAYPQCHFKQSDICKEDLPATEKGYDLIMISEVLWYILPNLQDVFGKARDALTEDGRFFVELYYPQEQNYGKEYLTERSELIERYLIPSQFKVEREIVDYLTDGYVQMLTLTK